MTVPATRRAGRLALTALALAAIAVPGASGAGPDVTPPVVVVSGATGAWSNAASVTAGASATDPESGVATVEYRTSTDDGATWTSPAVGNSVAVTDEGTTLVQFRATDNASNVSAWSTATPGAGGSVRLDRTSPTAPGAPPDQVQGVIAWFDASDGSTVTQSGGAVSRLADRSGNSNDATQTTPGNRPTLVAAAQNGRAVVRFATGGGQWLNLPSLSPRAILVAGRKQGVSNANVVIGSSSASDSYLAFGTSSGLGNAIAQNGTGAALSPAASEASWQVLGGVDTGSTITAYRNGGAGTAVSTGGATWAVDGIAVNPTAGFRLAGDVGEIVVFDRVPTAADRQLMEGYLAWKWGSQGSLVGGHPFATASPGAYGGTASWSLSGPRSVSVSGGSDGLSGVSTYDYRTSTDGGVTWGAPQSGSSVSVNTDGETLVQFRAIDTAGNVSAWSPAAGTAAATIRIDRVAPSVSVSGATGAWSNAASVTVTGPATDASSGVATTQYRTSYAGGAYSAPNTGSSVAVSAEGETLVQFRATDVAGNVSGWTTATSGGTGSVRLDRNAPATAPALTGATGTWSSAASVTVTASGSSDAGSGIGGYESRRSTDNGTSWSSPVAGASAVVSAEGTTLIQFRAVDNGGNAGPWSTATAGGYGSVRLDRTAPALPTTSGGSSSWLNTASRTITATGGADAGSGTAGYESATSTDGTTWSSAQAGATVTVSAEGQTLVRFRSVDAVGNASAWGTAETVRIDRGNPTISASGATGAWTNAASVTVTASAGDSVSSVATTEYRTSTDGGSSWSTPTAGASVAVTGETVTLVQFRATDAAGNASAWTASAVGSAGSVRIDRTAPTISQSGADGIWASAAAQVVSGSGSDPASGLADTQVRTSDDLGTTWSATASATSTTVTREGVTLVAFRATDNAGNTSAWTAAAAGAAGSVRLDRTSPSVSVAGATGAWSNAASVTATASSSDGDSGTAGYQYRTSPDNGVTWNAPQSGASVSATAEGVTLVQFRATDNAGNTSPWTGATAGGAGSIRIDRTVPVVTVSGADGSWSNAASVTVTGAASDALSGVSAQEARTSLDGGTTWSAPAGGGSVAVTGEGETLVQFRATDAAGNVSGWTAAAPGGTGSVRLDRAPPGAPLMLITPDTGVAVNSSRGAVTILTAPAPGDTKAVRVVVTQSGRLVHDGAFGTIRDEGLSDSVTYRYQAVAYDRLGNVSPVNESVITTPDRTPPSQPVAPDVTGWPPQIAWGSASGSTSYRVLRDGAVVGTASATAFSDPDARDVAPPLAPGGLAADATADGVLLRWMPVADRGTPYRYQVIATDDEGNSTASPEVTLESTSGGVSFEVALDGSPVTASGGVSAVAPSAVVTALVPLKPGSHDMTVTAIDAAGNRSEAARLRVRGPDPGPSTLTARASSAFARPGEDVTFTAGAPTGSRVRWVFPDGRTMTGASVTRSFRAGSMTAEVAARTADGIELTTQVTVVVDGAVPSLDTRMLGHRLRVLPQDATGIVALSARIDRGPARTVSGGTLAIPEGRHRVRLVATDGAGNTRHQTVTAIVDTRGPSVKARASTRPGAATGRIRWAARDGASGVAGVRVDGGGSLNRTGATGVAAGRVAVLIASDRYGNITRLTAPVPAPMRLNNLTDPGLQGRRGDRLLPGGPALVGIRAVVLTEARSRLAWAGVLRGKSRSDRYDATFAKAVSRFQTLRHVREPAGRGALGPTTLRAMDRLALWGGWGASAGRG